MGLNYGGNAAPWVSLRPTLREQPFLPGSFSLPAIIPLISQPADGEQKNPAPLNHNNLVRAGGDRKLGADGIADCGLLGQKMHCTQLLYWRQLLPATRQGWVIFGELLVKVVK